MATITRFFDHPNKWMNLLFVGLCMFIPVVGPIIAVGYCLVVMVHDLRRPGEMFPEFSFDNFVEYLKAGLWPVLVSLVAWVVAMPLMFCTFCPMFLAGTGKESMLILGLFLSMLLHIAGYLVVMMVMTPMMLRAGLDQTFGAGFNFGFVKDFVTRTWKELVVAMLFLFVVFMAAYIVGLLACFVGIYPAFGLMTFVSWQLYGQLYNLYLERGGETVAISAELLAPVEGDEQEDEGASDAGATPPTTP